MLLENRNCLNDYKLPAMPAYYKSQMNQEVSTTEGTLDII